MKMPVRISTKPIYLKINQGFSLTPAHAHGAPGWERGFGIVA
jgi:hypothetical protein